MTTGAHSESKIDKIMSQLNFIRKMIEKGKKKKKGNK